LTELYDAVVVGAGPAGSYFAYKLAELGNQVIVFERQTQIGSSVCCTGIVGKECFDKFPVAFNAVLAEMTSARLFSPSGKLLNLHKETVQAYIVDRAAFDNALAQRAKDEGADYHLSSRVDSIEIMNRCLRTRVEHAGTMTEFDSKVVAICNGFGGSLTKALGMGKIDDSVAGAQAEVSANSVDEVEVYFGQSIAPGFFAWLVPTSEGKALVGLLARRNPGAYLKQLLTMLISQGKIVGGEADFTYGVIPLMPLRKTYGERLVVIGDAAGHVKPTTGGGIYYGLLCADMAADTIHEALRSDDLSAKRLARYERRWKKMIARELQIGYWGRKLYENLSDNQIERIFDLIIAGNIHEELLQSPDFSFDWHGSSILRVLKHKALGTAIRSMTR
jgi:digeranylgeranylglycerophospholipid reductase